MKPNRDLIPVSFTRALSLVLACFFLTCTPPDTRNLAARVIPHLENGPTRRDLMEAMRDRRSLIMVYPASASAAARQLYGQMAAAISQTRRGGSYQVTLRTVEELTHEERDNQILWLLGANTQNSLLTQLAADLPLHATDQQVRVGDMVVNGADAVGMLSLYPSPVNRQLPIFVLTATDEAALENWLSRQLENSWSPLGGRSSWGAEIYQGAERKVLASFRDTSWDLDPALTFDFRHSLQVLESVGCYRLLGDPKVNSLEVVNHYARQLGEAQQKIMSFAGAPTGELPPLTLRVYASAEEKGLMQQNTQQVQVDFATHTIHAVLGGPYAGNLLGRENELLIRHLLGAPQVAALEEGLGIYFTTDWQQEGYGTWAGRLMRASVYFPLASLLDNTTFASSSRLLRGCLSAAFVEFLLQEWGQETFRQRYPSWMPSAGEITELEPRWRDYWLRKMHGVPAAPNNVAATLPYLKGFNFAHEGYGIYNGYISRQAARALGKIAEMGGSAVAVVPYSFMRDPQKPAVIPVAESPGSENDESVIHAVYAAHAQGLQAVLKPQIWFGGDRWPGDVAMNNEADWQAFFQYYEQWILHYAMLAEAQQVDLFCIGTEFAKATIQREADWRRLIAKVREIYHGPITYAANWGDEFENLRFWDALDYMGLNCYYPLSKDPQATDEKLREGFQDVLKRVARVQARANKPLLFTEIGFSSVEFPWINPHQDGYERQYNGENQRRCYQVVLDALPELSWCKGILWWEFPSYLDYGGRDNKGFSSNNKPAEAAIREGFPRLGK